MSNNKEENSNKNEKKEDSVTTAKRVAQKEKEEEEKLDNQASLNEEEIRFMKAYSLGPYDDSIKDLEKGVKKQVGAIEEAMGVKESDRGLAPSSQWDLNSDKAALQSGNFSFSYILAQQITTTHPFFKLYIYFVYFFFLCLVFHYYFIIIIIMIRTTIASGTLYKNN